ncbi:MAG: TauD/TfdA family dioxygenase [Cyanobacteria bacterium J06650_10]
MDRLSRTMFSAASKPNSKLTSQPTTEANVFSLSPFGVEIHGLDVRQIVENNLTELKRLLAEQGVAVIRNQLISDAEFVNFLKQLGPLTFTVGEKPVADQPLLNVVSNVGRDRPPRSVFHTDTSYITQPPAYTALKAIRLPSAGGETLFSNQYIAYERLPTAVKRQLRGAEVLHVVSGLTLPSGEETQTWHPLFRRHPLSGKLALYLSTPERCQKIRTPSGELAEKGAQIIRLLYRHSIRQHTLYRHRWQSGDIVIWDNRCTLHRADHSQVVGDRILHRGLISGEKPLPQTSARP